MKEDELVDYIWQWMIKNTILIKYNDIVFIISNDMKMNELHTRECFFYTSKQHPCKTNLQMTNQKKKKHLV